MSRGDLLSSAAPGPLLAGERVAEAIDALGPSYAFPWGRSPFEAEPNVTLYRVEDGGNIRPVLPPVKPGDAYVAIIGGGRLTLAPDSAWRSVRPVLQLPVTGEPIDVDRIEIRPADLEPFGMTRARDLLDEINGTLTARGMGRRGWRGRARR